MTTDVQHVVQNLPTEASDQVRHKRHDSQGIAQNAPILKIRTKTH